MSNSSFNVLQTTVNLELCKIDHWLRANKLSLYHNKSNFMLLTYRKHNPASFNPFSPACATSLAELCNPITREAIELESCSYPLQIQQVL